MFVGINAVGALGEVGVLPDDVEWRVRYQIERSIVRYQNDETSLAYLAFSLDQVIRVAKESELPNAERLRHLWMEVEEINAIDLALRDGFPGESVDVSEIDALLAEILRHV